MWNLIRAEFQYQIAIFVIGFAMCILPALATLFVPGGKGMAIFQVLVLNSLWMIFMVWMLTMLVQQKEKYTRRILVLPLRARATAGARMLRVPFFTLIVYVLLFCIFEVRNTAHLEWRHIRFLLSTFGFLLSMNAFFAINSDVRAIFRSTSSRSIAFIMSFVVILGFVLIVNIVLLTRFVPVVKLDHLVQLRQLLLDTAWTHTSALCWTAIGITLTIIGHYTFIKRRSYLE